MVSIRRKLGDRRAYLGGLPTAEVYAAWEEIQASDGKGVSTEST